MAAVHPQQPQEPLPPGWECRFDPRTGRYYYINHVDHATTWEDPRVRHSQLQQGSYAKYYLYGIGKPSSGHIKAYPNCYGTLHYPAVAPAASTTAPAQQDGGIIQVDERIMMKLCLQFPTVEEGHIWQLLKQYNNRENVVVSALLAEGHPRAQTHSMAVEQLTPKLQRNHDSQPLQVDESVVQKLHSFFPHIDLDHIRNLLKIHNNQEHEVIAYLASGSRGPSSRHQSPHPSSPKMKLRYLKLVFPEADEAILFDVLHNCDNNAQEASNRLIVMGYKKRDTPITRPNSGQQPVQPHRPVSEIPRPTLPTERVVNLTPPSAADKTRLMNNLQNQFPAVSRTLVNMALESSNYNEERAKQFLTAMTPQDKHSQPEAQSEITTEPVETNTAKDSSATSETAPPVPPRSRHTSSSQEASEVPIINEEPPSKKEELPSQDETTMKHLSEMAVSQNEILERRERSKFKKEVVKISKATSTHEDKESVSSYRTRPKGADSSLRKGPSDDHLLKEYMPWIGPDPKNRKGPNPSLCRGPDPNNRIPRHITLAKGPQANIRKGPVSAIVHTDNSSNSLGCGLDLKNCRAS